MSRTFRKKKQQRSDRSVNEKYVGGRFITLTGKDLMRQLHKEFGDAHSGKRNAPKWFRKLLNDEFDAKCRQALYNARTDLTDNVVFPVKKGDRNWEWF